MNTNPEIPLCVPGRNGDPIHDPEFEAVCAFYEKRRCLYMTAKDKTACVGIYVEGKVGVHVFTVVHDVQGNMMTCATLTTLTPPEARPTMGRFVELINERIPGGHIAFDPKSGMLTLACHAERPNSDTPLAPSVIEQHLAYCCRIFFLLSEFILQINDGRLREAELVESVTKTWPALETLLPYLADEEFPQGVLWDVLGQMLRDRGRSWPPQESAWDE